MKLYTGIPVGAKKCEALETRGVGVMISSSANSNYVGKQLKGFPCALDNGAFSCWQKGYPFMRDVFMETLAKCYHLGLKLDFIVCPDIVAGGAESLDFSMDWALGELRTAPNLALVVQDGMTESRVSEAIQMRKFSHLFVGGTPEWKWETLPVWVALAKGLGVKIHVGRAGKLKDLYTCLNLDVDSVDSTNWVRNDRWDAVDEIQGNGQGQLFS